MRTFELIGGTLLVAILLFDFFQTVVLPRPTPVTYRPTAGLIWTMFGLTRWVAQRLPSERREQLLGTFAPLSVVVQLIGWVVGLMLGFGLILLTFADQIKPSPKTLSASVYFSGVTMLTPGYGEYIATGPDARIVALIEVATWLGIVALIIAFLFALFGSFQRREVLVITLSARAGAPPSGVALLETYAKYGMMDALPQLFADWEVWAAEVLDSHLSYPILMYFRSTHDNQSWISALGAVLDAATLLLTTVDGVPQGPAKLLYTVGVHLVEDLSQQLRVEDRHQPFVEREEFAEARSRLAAAGFCLRDDEPSWLAFSKVRAEYAGALNTMARRWVTPPAQWIGDRSSVRHHARSVLHR